MPHVLPGNWSRFGEMVDYKFICNYTLRAIKERNMATEWYGYITKSNGLALQKYKGDHDFQDHLRVMKQYLGLFMARDEDHAREIAEALRDEYESAQAHKFIREAVKLAMEVKL